MNQEPESSAAINSTAEQENKSQIKFWIFIITIIVILGSYLLFIRNSNVGNSQTLIGIRNENSSIPDDQVFLNGFMDTGREWPRREAVRTQELKDNPLTKLREEYCFRVGYKYADFAGECFGFQYYNSYNSYTNQEEGFTVYYPKLWQENSEVDNNKDNKFVDNAKVSLLRKNASCEISYGTINEGLLRQTSMATTTRFVFQQIVSGSTSEHIGLSQITFPFNRGLTDEERAAGYTDVKLIAIPHFPYSNNSQGFLLRSGEKQPLSEACIDEFYAILNSKAINYPVGKLNSHSNGILSARDINSWFEVAVQIPQKSTLVFENIQTKREESIMPIVFQDKQKIINPFLSGGKLYFMTDDMHPTIVSIDIFSEQYKTIPLDYRESVSIHSFFVKGNDLYFIEGKFCNEYLAKCENLKLKKYNLITGTTEDLADGIKARDIDGFDSTGTKLILRWSEGDAGCSWGQYWSFVFLNRTVNDLGSYSVCDSENNSVIDQYEKLVTGLSDVGYLRIKDGKIFIPRSNEAYQSRIHFRVNSNEYPQE